MEISPQLEPFRQRIIDRLHTVLPSEHTSPQRLHAAMRYAALIPGKGIRGCLVYATGQALNLEAHQLDRLACAIELTHAYSLVHDDLPCMDDDETRRGKPACHIAYDEATALLAGNGLLTCAFQEVTEDENLSGTQRSAAITLLCQAIGSLGMIGGQQLDLERAQTAHCTLEELSEVYRLKTGCLIHAAVMLPAIRLAEGEAQREALDTYGQQVGLAFQIRDDLEDIEQDSAEGTLATYPALVGEQESRRQLNELGESAINALADFGERAGLLRTIGRWLIKADV